MHHTPHRIAKNKSASSSRSCRHKSREPMTESPETLTSEFRQVRTIFFHHGIKQPRLGGVCTLFQIKLALHPDHCKQNIFRVGLQCGLSTGKQVLVQWLIYTPACRGLACAGGFAEGTFIARQNAEPPRQHGTRRIPAFAGINGNNFFAICNPCPTHPY